MTNATPAPTLEHSTPSERQPSNTGGDAMRKLALALAIIGACLYAAPSALAQGWDVLLSNIEREIRKTEPEWQGGRDNSPVGIPGPDSPRGTSRHCSWERHQQIVRATVFYGDTKQDAVRTLEQSQQLLQINASRPLEGMGEQAYQYADGGGAWITFRKASVFVYVVVSVIDPRKLERNSPEASRLTAEALEIAKRFAQHIAEQIPAT